MTEPFNRVYLILEHVQSELNIEHLFNLRPTGKPPKPLLCVSAYTEKWNSPFLNTKWNDLS